MGKRYKTAAGAFDRQRNYPMEEALRIVKSNATAKFDETIEIHFRLGIDPRHSDQQVRTTVMLPHGTGKSVRILAFVDESEADATLAAGADIIGTDEVINKIRNDGWLEFDATIATPPMMRKVGQIARILGPRGLMPNPKAGTVVPADDLPRVINELKAGRVEFRNDKTGNLHVPVGKASFSQEQLQENLQAVVDTVRNAKPESQKGTFVRRVVLTSTMGPGVRVDGTI
ncbi:MAG: 50S ribosomal protein L1 [Chloroflexota bacterium]|nr:50S ribosomal protein L1 [Chloroflexota bacterium]